MATTIYFQGLTGTTGCTGAAGGGTGTTGPTGSFSGIVYQNLIPYTPNNISLGDTNNYFNGLYVANVALQVNSVDFTTQYDTMTITANTTAMSGNLYVQGTFDATNTVTGSLQVVGGAGIGQRLIVGSNQAANSTSSGALQVPNGGVGIGGALYQGGIHVVQNTTDATSTGTGALQVTGGVGISSNVYVGN